MRGGKRKERVERRKELANYRFRMAFYPFVFVSNKINWRFGRPYHCIGIDTTGFRDSLQPGIVILSHKNYELTNLFIRGYWTHSAMVVDEARVVEATSKGVRIRSVREFLTTVDDFILLRPLFCNTTQMEAASRYVKRVVGFPYNFSFMHGRKAFYCSELIYWAYLQACRELPVYREMDRDVSRRIVNPQVFFDSADRWQAVQGIFAHNTLTG